MIIGGILRLVGIILMSWGSFHAEFKRQVRKAPYNKLKDLSKEVSHARATRYKESHSRAVELVERGFTDEEFSSFIRCVHDGEARCAFMLMATLGLRVGELLNLEPGDLEGDLLRVRSLKGSYSAYMKLPPEILAGLAAHRTGKRMFNIQRKTLQDRFARARKEAGLEDVYLMTKPCGVHGTRNRRFRLSIHSLRHYAIQRFYRLTNDPDLTRAFARHRDLKSTQVYMLRDRREFMAEALQKMVPNVPALEVLA